MEMFCEINHDLHSYEGHTLFDSDRKADKLISHPR